MLSTTVRVVARCSVVAATLQPRWIRNAEHAFIRPFPIHAQRHRRLLSTPAPQVNESHLSVERYHDLSDTTMDSLLQCLEDLLDGLANPGYEVEYHSGVLTLVLGEHGTYVINKQPPNKQIWLSSPLSGPKRYDYSEDDDDWIYSRDGRALGDLLNNELSNALGREIDLGLLKVSTKL